MDLDSAVTNLAKTHPIMLSINAGSLNNDLVSVINDDGFTFMEKNRDAFDVV